MRTIAVAAFALAACGAALAGHDPACRPGAEMKGMRERIATLQAQMERIESTTDRAEQRRLMDLNAKMMREGMHEIRARPLDTGCRVEMMGSMMDVMIRHQQAMQEPEERR
ncbi:MAG: hypothetical protein ACXWHA_04885 [Usitatibacter sp.]